MSALDDARPQQRVIKVDLQAEFSRVPWKTVLVGTDTQGLAAQFNVTAVPTIVTVARVRATMWISSDT